MAYLKEAFLQELILLRVSREDTALLQVKGVKVIMSLVTNVQITPRLLHRENDWPKRKTHMPSSCYRQYDLTSIAKSHIGIRFTVLGSDHRFHEDVSTLKNLQPLSTSILLFEAVIGSRLV